MGYELHITRAEDWSESETSPISADEWLRLVEQDRELTIDPRDNGPYFALWLEHWIDGDHPWFDWFQCQICTKNPDRKTLAKMLQVAQQLGARVQGDDGEIYSTPDDLQDGGSTEAAPPKRWWQFWRRHRTTPPRHLSGITPILR